MRMAVGFVVVAAVVAVVAVKAVPELAARSTAVPPQTPPVARTMTLSGRTVAIPAGPDGHYAAEAVVNGHAISVIVDTGATAVALTADSARRLGLRLAASDFVHPVTTANGVVDTAFVTLSEIRIGTITVQNVRAVVVPTDALGANLLGMSFLNRIRKFEVGGGQLVLTD